MARREHIDDLLRGWSFESNSLSVRQVKGADGRQVIQMRIDLGLMQMETAGRPDGHRPEGYETYYDYLLTQVLKEGNDLELDDEQCAEVDREFVQFYHRRICWLALREFEMAVLDADHTLNLMDFCLKHSPDDHWTLSHEQYRPFVLFHRIQAAALAKLDEPGPEAAVQTINQGLERLRQVFDEYDVEEEFQDNELAQRLESLRESLREQFQVGRTLQEQLDDAVSHEQYELAAHLRDQLRKKLRRKKP